jgi:hypothetical protein
LLYFVKVVGVFVRFRAPFSRGWHERIRRWRVLS